MNRLLFGDNLQWLREPRLFRPAPFNSPRERGVPRNGNQMLIVRAELTPLQTPSKRGNLNPESSVKTGAINLFLLLVLIAGFGLIPAGRATAQTFSNLHSFTAISGSYPY